MKTLPKVDKKISQRVLKHEIGENYIKDKLKMAEETLVRMEKSKVLWGELIRFFDKMHQGFKVVAASSTSADETLAGLSKLHSGELQETLGDISITRTLISAQYQICANAIFDSFVLDVAYTMEPHLKKLAVLTKEVNNDGTVLRSKYAAAEKKFIKVKEKNPHMTQLQLQEHMKKFNDFKADNDKGKAAILQTVLMFEKERLTYLISSFAKVVAEEMALGKMMMSQKEKLEPWKNFSDSKNQLTGVHSDAVSVTRTLRPISMLLKKNGDDAKAAPNEESTQSGNPGDPFGERGGKAKATASNNKHSSWARATRDSQLNVKAEQENQKDKETHYEQEAEIIATCEEILADMRSCALTLEDELKLLDGLTSNALIDQINQILAIEELKKAENLIWEYEDYTGDFPLIFQERKYYAKKQFFKQSLSSMKERLNMLLEDELQVMQEEYAMEIGLDKTGRGASWYHLDATFDLDEPVEDSDFDFT